MGLEKDLMTYKQFWLWREIEVDDTVEKRNVDTTRCDVGHQEDIHLGTNVIGGVGGGHDDVGDGHDDDDGGHDDDGGGRNDDGDDDE